MYQNFKCFFPVCPVILKLVNRFFTYREDFPDLGRSVLLQTLVVKAVDLGRLSRLVISSQDRDPLGKANLKNKSCAKSIKSTSKTVVLG